MSCHSCKPGHVQNTIIKKEVGKKSGEQERENIILHLSVPVLVAPGLPPTNTKNSNV